MKFNDFIKPDLKKIIFLLIFLIPTILSILCSSPTIASIPPSLCELKLSVFPVEFEIVNWLINTVFQIGFYSFYFVVIITYIFDKSGLFAILFIVLFWYLISCIIFFSWNRVFDYFGGKKKQYEKFALMSLIILFIFIPIMLDGIIIIENKTRPNISIEINTRSNITIDEVGKYTIPPIFYSSGVASYGEKSFKEKTELQELRIGNYFLSQVTYKLPDITACINDIEGNLKLGLFTAYMTEDGEVYDVIEAKPESEFTVYLKIYGPGEVQPKEMFRWDAIPEYESSRLLESLKDDFGIDWVKNAVIEKIDGDKTIVVSNEKNHLSLSLNDEKTKVNLTIDDGRTYELFITSNPSNQLYIYKPIEIEKFDEILLFKNIGSNNNAYCHNATEEEVLAAEKIKISKQIN